MGNGFEVQYPGEQGTVHPHAYGERPSRPGESKTAIGSSPRIWGTVLPRNCKPKPTRFIPTHMGNGADCRTIRALRPVHPHAYGERLASAAILAQSSGSSPRIWGTAAPPTLCLSAARFIPTHMGNGLAPVGQIKPISVHPHAYGERADGERCLAYVDGSSPRIWGTGTIGELGSTSNRFIPTHMGNGSCAMWRMG